MAADVEDHAVGIIDVAGHGEAAGGGFADERGAVRILEGHHEVFAGAGADAIGEENETAAVGVLTRSDDGGDLGAR